MEMELCNSDIACNIGDLMSRYRTNIRGGLKKFNSNDVLRMWICLLKTKPGK